jgi:DHA1 family bicyclomycin/chloramphenicol resistance-like MFS transporter
MDLFPENAGASASAGSTIIFICGGLISALISLSPSNLQATLGYSFVLLSCIALALNRRISRRARALDTSPITSTAAIEPAGRHATRTVGTGTTLCAIPSRRQRCRIG